ncbi:unnamed protein product [Oikopleura dioica]|uniref:cullin-RING-type E3 NEDD8 transferase n=2 Tax=Oikopleura dioica TaxID=34765 RepID=E4XN48_OIKDI|nr:unnamed protein product [Oikopleura dioica]
MPAREVELAFVSASSGESFGSDDVFQSFSEEGNKAYFFRIMEQRKCEELVFDEEENVAELKDKNNSSSTFYSTQSDSSGLRTADILAEPSEDHFEFVRGSANASESDVLAAVDSLQPAKAPVKKELFISPSRLQKLTLEEDDKFEQDTVLFKLKTWNHVSLWKWDVDCDICAICRVVVTEPCLKCQSSGKGAADCAVVWGECNHSYHNCCMSRWVATTPRCPLCQQDWVVQRIGT